MDQATANFAEVIESEHLDLPELYAMRKAAFASEQAWHDLRHLAQTFGVGKPPTSHARRVKRGFVLLVLGRVRDAVKELEEGKAGQDAAGALILGRALLEAGEPAKALDAFEAGLKKSKGDLDLTLGAIEARRRSGEAEAALKDATAMEKAHGARADVQFQIGAALEATGDYDAAMERYHVAIERDPEHTGALFSLAYNHELRGSSDVALDYYKRCAVAVPTYANALVNMGLLLEDKERYQEAIDAYHRVLSIRPTHQRARLFLGSSRANKKSMLLKSGDRQTSGSVPAEGARRQH